VRLSSLVGDSIDIKPYASYTEAFQAAVEEASATGGQQSRNPFLLLLLPPTISEIQLMGW
jgi:hypothetical protein